MSNMDAILEFLEAQRPDAYCDDCLSTETGVEPRQQVNQICNRLSKQGSILRTRGRCKRDGTIKLVNAINVVPHPAPRSTDLAAPTGTKGRVGVDIEKMRTSIVRICQEIVRKHGIEVPSARGVAALINTLKDANLVPRHQANMMMTICNLRNVYVWDGVSLGDKENAIASAAWSIINEWSESAFRPA